MSDTKNNVANAAKSEWQNREIGALWKRTSAPSDTFPRGRTYLTGKIKFDEFGEEKTVNVVVFSNANKKNEKAPDFRIYISKESGEKASQTQDEAKSSAKPVTNREDSDAEIL